MPKTQKIKKRKPHTAAGDTILKAIEWTLKERIKELNAFYGLSEIIEKPDVSLKDIYCGLAQIIPSSFQYSDNACAKIKIKGEEYKSKNFRKTKWKLLTRVGKFGLIEVYYLKNQPFLKEEKKLVNALAERLEKIIERKEMEEALRDTEERCYSFIEKSLQGVWEINNKGKTTYCNKIMAKMLGVSRQNLIGRNFMEFMDKDWKKKAERFLDRRKKGISEIHEFTFQKEDGKPLHVLLSTFRIKRNYEFGAIAFVQDITDRKRLQEKEKEDRQLQEHFIADASHELRTPLAVLQTNLDLLDSLRKSKTSFSSKDLENFIETSKDQINYLATILEELLLLSRGKKPKEFREKINLGTIVRNTAGEMRPLVEPKNINYRTRVLNQDLEITGDERMLRKLVRNLISNAIKYGKEKGKIEIILKRENKEAKLQVVDDGVGISKKNLPYIFERFYRTDQGRSKKKRGIGLGLAICKRIVELHGGKIRVDSKYGKWSKFKISLPLSSED